MISEYYNTCTECGEVFETDAKWKNKCPKCFLKGVNPVLYANRYELSEITCVRCGKKFWGEGWKDKCYPCHVASINENKQLDVEEREQFK